MKVIHSIIKYPRKSTVLSAFHMLFKVGHSNALHARIPVCDLISLISPKLRFDRTMSQHPHSLYLTFTTLICLKHDYEFCKLFEVLFVFLNSMDYICRKKTRLTFVKCNLQ